jgi:hypothetical protein
MCITSSRYVTAKALMMAAIATYTNNSVMIFMPPSLFWANINVDPTRIKANAVPVRIPLIQMVVYFCRGVALDDNVSRFRNNMKTF